MAKYSKEAELSGSQSVLDAEREAQSVRKILAIAMNPDEFNKIWNKVSPAAKLNYIMNSQKYVLKEKGRETEADATLTNDKLDDLDKKMQALSKLLNS